jgi:hypothetical protein
MYKFRFIKSANRHWIDTMGGDIVLDRRWMVTTNFQHTVHKLLNWCHIYDGEQRNKRAEDCQKMYF